MTEPPQRLDRPTRRTALGFYALHNMDIEADVVPPRLGAKLRRNSQVGAVYIAMLAVASNHQGKGLGSLLLASALKRIKRLGTILEFGPLFSMRSMTGPKNFMSVMGSLRSYHRSVDYSCPWVQYREVWGQIEVALFRYAEATMVMTATEHMTPD